MIAGVIVAVVLIYAAFHVGAGHTHHRYQKAHGLRPAVFWRSGMRGPWVSIRGPFGTRIGHRL